jgi:uncharacterized protein (DUF427 family)
VYQCHFKGSGKYYNIVINGQEIRKNGAWMIPNPPTSAGLIKGMYGFFRDKGLKMEFVKDEL